MNESNFRLSTAQLAADLYGLCYTIEPRGIKRGDDVRDTSRDATCERRGVMQGELE